MAKPARVRRAIPPHELRPQVRLFREQGVRYERPRAQTHERRHGPSRQTLPLPQRLAVHARLPNAFCLRLIVFDCDERRVALPPVTSLRRLLTSMSYYAPRVTDKVTASATVSGA